MGYYSVPTASQTLGGINREFSRLEKKSKKLRKLMDEGRLSPKSLEKAQDQFKGIYRHVLTIALKAKKEEQD